MGVCVGGSVGRSVGRSDRQSVITCVTVSMYGRCVELPELLQVCKRGCVNYPVV